LEEVKEEAAKKLSSGCEREDCCELAVEVIKGDQFPRNGDEAKVEREEERLEVVDLVEVVSKR
jgi:hypothetical protein